jgi:two-component system sensor histidine kinase AlgZ
MSEPPNPSWFPNFCRIPTVFAVMVIAELVVLIIALSPTAITRDNYTFITTVSFLVQWIAVVSAGLLCFFKPQLSRLPVVIGSLLAYLLILTVCAAASWTAGWIDQSLGLGFSASLPSLGELVLGNVLVCALVAAAALRYFYIQHRWRRDIEARADAQLRALQARIRPHFLFNCMNTIAALIRSSPERAERAVEDLSELFRAVLRTGSGSVNLADEVALSQRYLHLEQLRLGSDRLAVKWQIDDLPMDALLPSLILQPLVENAVNHGIQHLASGGTVTISGHTGEDCFVLRVDNPLPEQPGINRDRGNGVALDNIRARLQQRFEGRATMELIRCEGTFRVELSIPIETA